jgi:hypothetical protein
VPSISPDTRTLTTPIAGYGDVPGNYVIGTIRRGNKATLGTCN